MFPLQPGNNNNSEMVIEFSRSPHHDNLRISPQDLNNNNNILHHHPTPIPPQSHHHHPLPTSKKSKKIVHREIERQRRQEMASLYSSLRSLLPLEFIKGKRSISDHMNEAVNYIKHLEKNIKELNAKRDKLKKFLVSNDNNSSNYYSETHIIKDEDEKEEEEEGTSRNTSFFSVHEINNNEGVGIEVTCGFRDHKRLPLSKLLQVVLEEDEGLEVVNCVSTQVNGRFILSVQCEVNNSDLVDLPALRRKIVDLVPSFRCSDYDH
ncbi:transcription factor bHLH118-like [Senna tora]|uniref:Transcription factor bHLH118-like n=1 Tax=Senna tora TaxID=362788 RepID=A0A834T217_9FABA|nr:transcription factor bHLH118-like [Senna tora]